MASKQQEKAVLRKTERAMVRAMWSRKVVNKKSTRTDGHAEVKANCRWVGKRSGVRWYGHVLRIDDDSVLRIGLGLKVSSK